MAITGAVLGLLGAVLVIVATAWELIDVRASRHDLDRSLVKWENWRERWKSSEAERVMEGGFVMKVIPPDRVESWRAERAQLSRELSAIDPRESHAFDPLTPADLERAVLAGVWRTLTRQGLLAAIGGLLSVIGALCTIVAL